MLPEGAGRGRDNQGMAAPADQLVAQLRAAIADPSVLDAILAVPRDRFLPSDLHEYAYADVALPIAGGQTISQPYVIARMLELLQLSGDALVLDVGTGSGYHAALLARLAGEVISVERDARLSAQAATTLRDLGIANVELHVADGSDGFPARAPYDAINVAAAMPPAVVRTLGAQLRPGGRLVAPVTPDPSRPLDQRLVLAVREGGERLRTHRLERVSFVPLVPGLAGPAGRPQTPDRGGAP